LSIGGDSGEAEHAFRDDPKHPSERSDAGISIVQEVFGFIKTNLSEAERKKDVDSTDNTASLNVSYSRVGNQPTWEKDYD
jgi:hypothetical protein